MLADKTGRGYVGGDHALDEPGILRSERGTGGERTARCARPDISGAPDYAALSYLSDNLFVTKLTALVMSRPSPPFMQWNSIVS